MGNNTLLLQLVVVYIPSRRMIFEPDLYCDFFGCLDLVFAIDTTGSMQDNIDEVPNQIDNNNYFFISTYC
jgi:hypothetical protein